MPRPGAPVVLICVAVAAFAALLPGGVALGYAILSPQWVVVPDCRVVVIAADAARGSEQPVALLSVRSSRAPPAS